VTSLAIVVGYTTDVDGEVSPLALLEGDGDSDVELDTARLWLDENDLVSVGRV